MNLLSHCVHIPIVNLLRQTVPNTVSDEAMTVGPNGGGVRRQSGAGGGASAIGGTRSAVKNYSSQTQDAFVMRVNT